MPKAIAFIIITVLFAVMYVFVPAMLAPLPKQMWVLIIMVLTTTWCCVRVMYVAIIMRHFTGSNGSGTGAVTLPNGKRI